MTDHQPIDPKFHQMMNELASTLNQLFAPNGFALLVFPLGPQRDGRVNYISNAERQSMIQAMKDFIARHEREFPPA